MARVSEDIDYDTVKWLAGKRDSGRVDDFKTLLIAFGPGDLHDMRDTITMALEKYDVMRVANDPSAVSYLKVFPKEGTDADFWDTLHEHSDNIPEGFVWFAIRGVKPCVASEHFPNWSLFEDATTSDSAPEASMDTSTDPDNNTVAPRCNPTTG